MEIIISLTILGVILFLSYEAYLATKENIKV